VLQAVTVKIKISTAGNRGFTLLELIIVLFIVVLSVAVVIFSAGRLHEKTIFNEEARKIYQTLKRARELSLMERRDIAFRVDSDANKYWIDNGSGVVNSHTVHEGVLLSGKDVIFFSKGNSSGGQSKINNAKRQEFVIDVDPILGTSTVKRF
jgi:prepilin-type N-terminal cleavage/methylation domain-containing protein